MVQGDGAGAVLTSGSVRLRTGVLSSLSRVQVRRAARHAMPFCTFDASGGAAGRAARCDKLVTAESLESRKGPAGGGSNGRRTGALSGTAP